MRPIIRFSFVVIFLLLQAFQIHAQLVSGIISPATQSIAPGDALALTSTASSGGVGVPPYSYTYQWQSSYNNVNWTNISGATSGTGYSPGELALTTYYRLYTVQVGTQVGAYSNVAVITVGSFTLQPGAVSPAGFTINYNTSPGTLTGTAPSGGNGSFSYQWQQSANNTTWTNINGATVQNYTPGNLTATTYFRREVTSNGETQYSNICNTTVLPQLLPGSISPVSATVNYNTSPGQLTGTLATGGNGTFSYQWQQSADNSNWTNVSGAVAASHTPGALTATTYYRRSVTSNGLTALSNVSTISVIPALNPGIVSVAATALNYNTAPAQISGTLPTGGTGVYVYKWQRSTDNYTWNIIAGATGQHYQPPTLTNSTYFRREVSSGEVKATNTVMVTVYPQLEGGILLPGSSSIIINTNPGTMGVNSAVGGNGTYSYQWQSSDDNIIWNNLAGATSRDYNPGNLTTAKWYRRQVTSNGVLSSSVPIQIAILQPVVTSPANYATTAKVNFVRTWSMQAPEQSATNLLTRPLRDVKQSTTYADGLGRPIQQVIKQGALATGSTAIDFVSTTYLNGMGREVVQYLPFAANNTGGNMHVSDGMLKRNPLAQLAVFAGAEYGGEPFLYASTTYQASPLEEVEKRHAPGSSWAGSDRGVTVQHFTNTSTDDVKKWVVTDVPGGFGTYAVSGAYSAGELFKEITTDEQGIQRILFTDKDKRTILKKVQLTAVSDIGTGKDYNGWLCTYYVYDEIGNLRCVLQPKAVELIRPSFVLTDAVILAEQCFRYEYDNRQHVIKKSMPGTGEVWMVYDARDRMVLSQDANLRNNAPAKWMYTQYDELDRVIATGLWPNSQSQEYHAGQAAASTSYPTLSGEEQLTITHYDDYNDLPAGFSSSVNSNDATAFFTGPFNASPEYAQPWVQSKQTIGLMTWTKSKILGTSNFITTVHYYDDMERVIQVQAQNITGGIDIHSMQYSFSGQLLRSVARLVKAGNNPKNIPLCTRNTFDELGRLTKVEHGQNFTSMKTVSQQEYDALSRLKIQKLGTTSGGAALETQRFDYNIRGWLLGVNRAYLQDSTSIQNFFGYDLGYDKDNISINGVANKYAAKQFNGNIAGVLWKSTGDDQTRKMDYTYDAAKRLTGASFTQLNAGAFNTSAGIDFSMRNMSYDVNGNIMQLLQLGWKPGGSRVIDSLSYNYISKTNKLKNVIDLENDTATRLSDFRASKSYMNALGGSKTSESADYSYDLAGNMISDKNKDIGKIEYTFLGMPSLIRVPGKGTIEFIYDAKGAKLKKVVTDSLGATVRKTTTLYLDQAVFQSREHNTPQASDYVDSLQYYQHPEGRVRLKNAVPQYDYFLKDHLGNIRMVLSEEQQTDAYLNASMETAATTNEELYYFNLNTTRADKPEGYPTDTYTNPNEKVARLRGDGPKIGPAIVLKVMAGDKFNLRVNSWYRLGGSTPAGAVNPVSAIVSALAAVVPGVSVGKVAAGQLNGVVLDPAILSFLDNRDASNNASKPKAHVNYLLLDEQFKPVITGDGKNSGAEQVGGDLEFKTHLFTDREITKNGYLYIYLSNETPNIYVYFDNLQVTHIRGPLLEESHYYPSGLLMEGISSKAFAKLANANKFNNGNELQHEEFQDGTGMEIYDAQFRMYDPQIGRFHQIDPLADASNSSSTYSFGNGNPILSNDPLGLISTPDNPEILPTYTITHRKLYLRGFHWQKSTKKEVNLFRQMQYRYDVRRRAGLPESNSGDGEYYLNNLASFRRRFEAERDGRAMQVGAVAAIFAPVAGLAIAETVPLAVIGSKVSAEAGLIRIAGQLAKPHVLKYGGRALAAAGINLMQNGMDYTKMDVIDISTNTVNPAPGLVPVLLTNGINSLYDLNPFATEGSMFKGLGFGKTGAEVALDFEFGMVGEGFKGALGGGNATVNFFSDIVTGNLGSAAQTGATDNKNKK